MFSYFIKENNYNITKRYEVLYDGILERDIIEELKTLGFTFKFGIDNRGRYYALVGIEEKLLEGLK